MGKRKYKGRGSEKCSGNISTLSSKEKKLKKKKSEQTYMFVCVCIYIYIYSVKDGVMEGKRRKSSEEED